MKINILEKIKGKWRNNITVDIGRFRVRRAERKTLKQEFKWFFTELGFYRGTNPKNVIVVFEDEE